MPKRYYTICIYIYIYTPVCVWKFMCWCQTTISSMLLNNDQTFVGRAADPHFWAMLTMVSSICHCHMSMYTLIRHVGQSYVLAIYMRPICMILQNYLYDHKMVQAYHSIISDIRVQGPSFLVGWPPRLGRRHRHRRTAPQAAWPHRRPPPVGNPAPPAPAAEPPGPGPGTGLQMVNSIKFHIM